MSVVEQFQVSLVTRLSMMTGTPVTYQDYEDWLSGGEGYAKVEGVVRRFLGDSLYKSLEEKGLVVSGLCYFLGFGPRMQSGFDFETLTPPPPIRSAIALERIAAALEDLSKNGIHAYRYEV